MNLLTIWLQEIARWIYWFPFRYLVHHLSSSHRNRLGYWLGKFYYRIARKKREALIEGMRFLFAGTLDGSTICRLVTETFDQAAKNALENLMCARLDKQFMDDLIVWEGLDNLNRTLAQGKGAIFMHGHFGNEELIMPAIGYKGYRMNQLASRWKPAKITQQKLNIPDLIRERIHDHKIATRERYPVKFIYIDAPIREAFNCLKRNEILAVAFDGREGSKWLEINFLNRRWMFSPGPMHIAIATGAPVLPVFIVRKDGYRHHIIIHPPLDITKTGNKKQDIQINTENFARLLETYVLEYPSQYLKFLWVEANFFI